MLNEARFHFAQDLNGLYKALPTGSFAMTLSSVILSVNEIGASSEYVGGWFSRACPSQFVTLGLRV